MPAASVINVFPLFFLCRHCAVVVRTLKQTTKRKIMLTVPGAIVPSKYFLHRSKQVSGNYSRVRSLVGFSRPNKQTAIKRILEQFFQIAFRNFPSCFYQNRVSQSCQRIFPRGIQFKSTLDHGSGNWINRDCVLHLLFL